MFFDKKWFHPLVTVHHASPVLIKTPLDIFLIQILKPSVPSNIALIISLIKAIIRSLVPWGMRTCVTYFDLDFSCNGVSIRRSRFIGCRTSSYVSGFFHHILYIDVFSLQKYYRVIIIC